MMQSDRFVFRGTPREYHRHLQSLFTRNRTYFENAFVVLGGLKMNVLGKREVEFVLGEVDFVKVGRKIHITGAPPLVFKDGSIFVMRQTICYDQGVCWAKESVILFAKLDSNQVVRYLFHYDTVEDIPNHPDHHLQIEFSTRLLTPRFPLRTYENVDTILHMIIRDKVA